MTTELMEFKIMVMDPVLVIGKEIICKMGFENGNPIPGFWDKCFNDGTVKKLESLPNLAYPGVLVGWMGNFDQETGEFSYIVGVLSQPTDSVPEEFEAIPMDKMKFAVGTVKGKAQEIFMEGYNLTEKAMRDDDLEPNMTGMCCEIEWYDERFCQNSDYHVIDILIPIR